MSFEVQSKARLLTRMAEKREKNRETKIKNDASFKMVLIGFYLRDNSFGGNFFKFQLLGDILGFSKFLKLFRTVF